jgi:hypothetical protein
LAGPNGAGGAAATIENLSIKLTEAITGFGYLVDKVKIAQPILIAAGLAIGLAWAPWFTAISVAALAIGALGNAMKKNNAIPAPNNGPLFFPTAGEGGYKEREAARKKAENDAIVRNKKLAQAIKDQDKANVLLGKGEDVFNIDKIQIAAALTNQAQALGKATTFAQQLQIANDTARLRVKQSILELEDAIASGDIKSIELATTKLNKDLQILGALTGQNVQLKDIESILAGLKPKDLVNQSNLDKALATIKEMLALLAEANRLAAAPLPKRGDAETGTGFAGIIGDYVAPVTGDVSGASVDAIIEYGEAATNRANAIADLLDDENAANQLALDALLAQVADTSSATPVATAAAVQSGNRYAAQAAAAAGITLNVNTSFGVVGDPNAAAELIDQVIIDAVQRGTLREVYAR